MKLKLLLPTRVMLEEEVDKVAAESTHGAFTVLPRHIDFTSLLTPGLLSFRKPGGHEEFLAVDEGVMVKRGAQVLVATGNAVYGPDLALLQATVQSAFENRDQQERQARTALARLETDFVRRYIELME